MLFFSILINPVQFTENDKFLYTAAAIQFRMRQFWIWPAVFDKIGHLSL